MIFDFFRSLVLSINVEGQELTCLYFLLHNNGVCVYVCVFCTHFFKFFFSLVNVLLPQGYQKETMILRQKSAAQINVDDTIVSLRCRAILL